MPKNLPEAAAPIDSDLTVFERDLGVRGLLDVAFGICRPLGLRPSDLQHVKKRGRVPRAAPVVVDARSKFAHHLEGLGWSTRMISRLLGYGPSIRPLTKER